jgi:organic radical activating enzyme
MFKKIPRKFDYTIKRMFGKDIKIIQNCCNRTDMSCCGGGCCKSLFLNTNNYCNANCSFCIVEKGLSEISDFVKLESIIDELLLNDVISKVVLTGGEPLLHPKFKNFLRILDSKKLMYYSLNTNGILLNDYIEDINNSNLKHINISMHHYKNEINKKIMVNCLKYEDIEKIRKNINNNIEIRLACTITENLYKESDILNYINNAKLVGINNVIFRNEYRGFNKYLSSFRKIWNDLYTADICNCGYKLINGVNAEYRESNINLKQDICNANTYFRDFIYSEIDILSGSWNRNSQVIL